MCSVDFRLPMRITYLSQVSHSLLAVLETAFELLYLPHLLAHLPFALVQLLG